MWMIKEKCTSEPFTCGRTQSSVMHIINVIGHFYIYKALISTHPVLGSKQHCCVRESTDRNKGIDIGTVETKH